MNEKLREVIATALRKQNNMHFKCFKEECDKPAIDSHSQSLAAALRTIAEDNHLIALRPRHFIGKQIDFNSFFQSIGVRRASTFKGFCKDHDTENFRCVDTIEPQNITKEALARLAFRTFAYEERTKEKWLFLLDYLVANAYDLCDVSYMQSTAAGMRNHLTVTKPFYLNRFVTIFKSGDYEPIQGTVFVLDKTLPLSSSTVLDPTMINSSSVMNCDMRKPLNQVFFALIPQADSSLVAFVYFKEQHAALQSFLAEFGSLESILFNHCEEILMSPSFYCSLSSNQKRKIINGLRAWSFWERQDFSDILKANLKRPIHI